MSKIEFTYGTMNSGKSTLALQIKHQLSKTPRKSQLWTFGDRSREGRVTSRVGISEEAFAVNNEMPFLELKQKLIEESVSILIIDEIQFAKVEFIDNITEFVDDYNLDLYLFGLASDFTFTIFPAAARLFIIADKITELPAPSYCWCGSIGKVNSRIINNEIVKEGARDIISDVDSNSKIYYKVLCRKHFKDSNLG